MRMVSTPPVDRNELARLADTGDLCPNAVGYEDFATEDDFHTAIGVCDPVFITGFPGLRDRDRTVYLERPVAIGGWLASDPRHDVEGYPGVSLTGALSWAGLSGGLVTVPERGIQTGSGLSGGNYRRAKAIGINTGHWFAGDRRGSDSHHSGLSTMVRAPAIVDLIDGSHPPRGAGVPLTH